MEVNWQLQYVIGFVMLSTMEVDMSEEIRTKSQELLRKEFGISKEEWAVFTKQVAREGKILHARLLAITAQLAAGINPEEVK
tara:strand:- start:4 stop:249 length:246 start_codon:yes stop_codon:yes gene_type:complete